MQIRCCIIYNAIDFFHYARTKIINQINMLKLNHNLPADSFIKDKVFVIHDK